MVISWKIVICIIFPSSFKSYMERKNVAVIEDEVKSWWLRLAGSVVKENGTLQNELRLKAHMKNQQNSDTCDLNQYNSHTCDRNQQNSETSDLNQQISHTCDLNPGRIQTHVI